MVCGRREKTFECRGASPSHRRAVGGTGRDFEVESLVVGPIRVSGVCHDPDRGPSLDHALVTIDDPDHGPNRGHDRGRKRIAKVGRVRRLHPLLSRRCCLEPLAKMRAIPRETQCRRSISAEGSCAMQASTALGRPPVVDHHGVEVGEKEVVDRDR